MATEGKTDRLQVERLGGLAGFGGSGGRLRSHGEVAASALSARDQQAVHALFAQPSSSSRPAPPSHPDGFRYRLTRQTPQGPQSVEVPEAHVPEAVRAVVKDELAGSGS
ncbi:MAG TPA: protealysin inhibitor emfourin [Burkholderiaceae bacterium]|jgi:hypothetical protein